MEDRRHAPFLKPFLSCLSDSEVSVRGDRDRETNEERRRESAGGAPRPGGAYCVA